MTENDNIVLDVWKGDWGLPSINTECLQILAYARFNKIPIKINTVSNPFLTPHSRLPLLRYNKGTLDTVQSILRYFKDRNYDLDLKLEAKQRGDILAYDNMLKDKLYPALQYIWWIDKKNLNDVIRPWYCTEIPFPLNFYYPGKFEREAKELIEILYPTVDDTTAVENSVYQEAKKCLTLLSTKLGENKYFFGSHATSLDSIVYAYLAPLLKAPLPNAVLQNHLKNCPNLVKFVTRISQEYFQEEYQAYKHKLEVKNEKASKRIIGEERKTQLLAGLFALCAMMGYAILNGIIKVPHEDVMTYDDNNYNDDTMKYMLDDDEEVEEEN